MASHFSFKKTKKEKKVVATSNSVHATFTDKKGRGETLPLKEKCIWPSTWSFEEHLLKLLKTFNLKKIFTWFIIVQTCQLDVWPQGFEASWVKLNTEPRQADPATGGGTVVNICSGSSSKALPAPRGLHAAAGVKVADDSCGQPDGKPHRDWRICRVLPWVIFTYGPTSGRGGRELMCPRRPDDGNAKLSGAEARFWGISRMMIFFFFYSLVRWVLWFQQMRKWLPFLLRTLPHDFSCGWILLWSGILPW